MRRLSSEQKGIVLYVAKCVTGFAGLSLVGGAFDINDISWIVISMLLVLSPDSSEVIPLTVVRVKSNLVASVASVLFLFLCGNVTVAICLSIVVTIIACYYLDLMSGSRPALAAIVIILLHPVGVHLWSTALERVLAVVAGCALGLVLTFVFHRQLPMRWQHRQNATSPTQNE